MRKLGRITIEDGKVTEADHDIRYMKGWITTSVKEYVKTCKWAIKKGHL